MTKCVAITCHGCRRMGFWVTGTLNRSFCSTDCEDGYAVREALRNPDCRRCGQVLQPNEGLVDLFDRIPGRYCSAGCLHAELNDVGP